MILSTSCSSELVPLKKKVIRVDDFHQYMVIQEDGQDRTRGLLGKQMIFSAHHNKNYVNNERSQKNIAEHLHCSKEICNRKSHFSLKKVLESKKLSAVICSFHALL